MKSRYAGFRMPPLVLVGLFFVPLPSLAQLPNAWQVRDNSTAGGALNYATNQPPDLHTAATNSSGGFDYAVNARFVAGGTKALFMAYGLGDRRFLIWWELNGSGDLTAE